MRKYSCFSKAAPLVKGLECLPKDRGVYQGSPDTVGRGGGRLLCPSLPPPHVTVVRMLARSLKSRSSPRAAVFTMRKLMNEKFYYGRKGSFFSGRRVPQIKLCDRDDHTILGLGSTEG